MNGVMQRPRAALAVAVWALWLIGCSGETDGGTLGGALPNGGASASGSGSASGTGGAGSGLGGSVSGAGAGAGAGAFTGGTTQTTAGASPGGSGQTIGGSSSNVPPAACSSFVDDAAWKLTVHIKNQKSTAVYLGPQTMGCDAARLFDVADGSRSLLPGLEACRSSCSAVMTSGPVVCPAVCASPSTVMLAPGQTIDIPWDGLFGVPSTVPAECMHTATPSPTACVRAQQIKNGLFTFSAKAGATRECLSPAACTCTPNPSGGCTTPGSLISGTITTTDFIIALDPGESSVGADPQYIGLVFKDQ